MAARREEKNVIINKTTIITMTFKRIIILQYIILLYRNLRLSWKLILRRFLANITICIIAVIVNAIFYAYLPYTLLLFINIIPNSLHLPHENLTLPQHGIVVRIL